MVDRLDRLRHHAVIGGDHQDRDVGGLGAARTHGGERLVTRGVDEGDGPLGTVVLDRHLVGADVLGDAAGLALADGGVADGVQQPGLAVVDVTHHGDHRRAELEVLLAALVLAVGEVEGLQQLAVLVLRGDDLNLVVHLAAQQFQDVVADRLRRGDHLAEVEQRLHQRGRVGVDLLGEVAQRRTASQANGLAIALGQPDATDDRSLHVLVFGAFGPLRLATPLGCATGASERTRGAAALAGTTAAAGATTETTATAAGTSTGSAAAVVATTAAGTTAAAGLRPTTGGWTRTATGTGTATGTRATAGPRGHVAGRGARARAAAGAGSACAGTRSRALGARRRTLDRLLRGEGVVADARGARGGPGTGLRSGSGPGTRRGPGPRGRAGSGSGGRLWCGGRCRGGRGRRGRRLRGGRGLGRGGAGFGHLRRAGFGRGGPLGRRRRSRLGRCTVRGSGAAAAALVAGGLVAAERLAQTARYRGLHGGGRGFDEFALFAQTGEHLLTGDTEFLGQLVHTGLTCHYISCLEATAVVGAAPRFSYDAWSSGLHGVLMFFATCSLGAAVSGRSDESKRSITAVMSGEPVIRSARPNARRRTAACRHSDRGCNQAPRPGSAFAVSTVTTTWPFPGPSPLSTATTRSNSTASSRFRHPMQVRTGPGGGLLRCIRADSSRWTTAESTVTASPN